MVIVEIPTTIRSTILGKTNAVNNAIIPNTKVAILIIVCAFLGVVGLELPQPTKSLTAEMEIII